MHCVILCHLCVMYLGVLGPVMGPPQYASPCANEQQPRAFSLEVTAHVGGARYRTPSVYQV